MIVLGIDPGSIVTGYAFLRSDARKITVLEYGCIRVPATLPLHERLGRICHDLEELLQRHHPVALAMEESFFAKNARTALVLGHARGAVLATVFRHGMTVNGYSPSTIKQGVTGKGSATKERVATMVQRLLQLNVRPDSLDASDALAVAWFHLEQAAHPIVKVDSVSTTPRNAKGKLALPKAVSQAVNALSPGDDITALLAQSRKRAPRRGRR